MTSPTEQQWNRHLELTREFLLRHILRASKRYLYKGVPQEDNHQSEMGQNRNRSNCGIQEALRQGRFKSKTVLVL